MGLSKEHEDAYRTAFKKFDKDGNGQITGQELSRVLKALGQNPSEAQVKEMIDSVDTDGSGTIEWDEFLNLMTTKNKSAPPPRVLKKEEIKRAFQAIDDDGNGYLTAPELKAALQKLGQHHSDDDIQMMIHEVDKDGDGKVNWEEFSKCMVSQ